MERTTRWWMAAVLAAISGLAACKDQKVDLAAVPLESGQFGALMVSSQGEALLPIVQRNESGQPTAVTGALWMDGKGTSALVELDPATGLPTRTVYGDFIVLFSNWSSDRTTVDIARIYPPTGFVEIRRQVPIQAQATTGALTAAATCLPDCPSYEATTAELLKVTGLGLSIGTCLAAGALSWGAMLLPCTGAVVSAAKMASSEDSWLNGTLERAGKMLTGVDIVQCLGGDPGGCTSLFLDFAAKEVEKEAKVVEQAQQVVDQTEGLLRVPDGPAGIQSGEPPDCIDRYECTPGAYLPCYPEGTKQCDTDCTWGDCPKPKPEPSGMTQCSDNVPTCNCSHFQACVTMGASGACTGWYKTSAGNFYCASCSNCTAAAANATHACCPETVQ